MKRLIKFSSFFLATVIIFTSCKKEIPVTSSAASPPVFTVVTSISCPAKEYDVDITLNNEFSLIKNYIDAWGYSSPDPNSYYDYTQIIGKGIILPFGEFNIYVDEYADTAALNDTVYGSYFLIVKGNINPLYIEGYCSINLKKLIRQGGGSFNGTFTVASGSAEHCNINVFTNSVPLNVTGSLDVATHIVNLRIKGKVYF
ncbi:MAG: hypothetical protein JWN83_1165 [Chitinophagaceae bacterium]|nr:hypothetical protein [Chitinophagaceae bacterium]